MTAYYLALALIWCAGLASATLLVLRDHSGFAGVILGMTLVVMLAVAKSRKRQAEGVKAPVEGARSFNVSKN